MEEVCSDGSGGGIFLIVNPLRGGDINSTRYWGMFPFVYTGVYGTIITVRLSALLNQYGKNLGTALCFLGSRTMPIILFHWMAFNAYETVLKHYFVVDTESLVFKIGLFIVGVCLPIVVDSIYVRIKVLIFTKEIN